MTNRPKQTEIDLVPLKLFSERIAQGWTMVPGYPLAPGDYAVTMMPPDFPKPRTNRSAAASVRNEQRWENYRADQERRKAPAMAGGN